MTYIWDSVLQAWTCPCSCAAPASPGSFDGQIVTVPCTDPSTAGHSKKTDRPLHRDPPRSNPDSSHAGFVPDGPSLLDCMTYFAE